MSDAGSPLEPLAEALYSALLVDLKPIQVPGWKYTHPTDGTPAQRVPDGKVYQHRPSAYQVNVEMFVQNWSSTALGFGGIGGQAFTNAYTIIISGPSGEYAVYFGGRFAYMIEHPTDKFYQDLREHSMLPVAQAGKYKKAAT